MPSPSLSFRLGTLAGEILARGDNANDVARRDLERYYEAMRLTIREEVGGLRVAEWAYLADILTGTFVDLRTADYLWAEVQDADPELAVKHHVDAADLSARLRALPLFARLAICDAVEWMRREREP